ncbi:molybdenum cofactor guanylyltransferase MobA [Frigidibacter sp. ROC022]|uniref:molybdenum cofactor guanylyltransferase MobA n=1 Tax=Frigidibacter sp. ROC022 TaxID=2971796 RepID=UPI00215A835D|nr:molybdenum cofactor guanylyltransferase MobA [Frigidibacter sp. ROC022]MCR8724921.1 molybdenum cofactor guanylyltransferase MobA [Frigidibacter sp. ROC022]
MRQPFGLILAGGRGSRMGGADKAFLTLGGSSLLARVIDRFAPQVDRLALSANGDPARFSGFGLPVLPDPVPGFPGPLAGLLAGLDWAAGAGAETLVTVATDTPFLPPDLVPRLLLAGDGGPALAATPGGLHPTFALWPVTLAGALRDRLAAGHRRLSDFAAAHGAATASFPDQPFDPFLNINTAEDLARAEAML